MWKHAMARSPLLRGVRSSWLNELRPSGSPTVVAHLGPIWPPQWGATIHNTVPITVAASRSDSVIVYVTRDEPSSAERDFAASARCPILWVRSPDRTRLGTLVVLLAAIAHRRPFHTELMARARRSLPGHAAGFLLLHGAAAGFVRQNERSRSVLSLGDFDPEYAHNAYVETPMGPRRVVRWITWRLSDRFFPRTYATVARVVTVSVEDADLVSAVAPGSRVTTIPVTVPTEIAEADPEPISRLVFLGAGERNLSSVTWSIAHVLPALEELGVTMPFVVAGRLTDAEVARIDRARREAGIPDGTVHIVRDPADPAAILRPGSMLLCPFPRGSGVKVKCLEAMLRSCPVATNEAGARGTPLADGKTGVVQESGERLADSIATLLGDPSRAVAVARAARGAALATHGPGRQTTAWESAWPS